VAIFLMTGTSGAEAVRSTHGAEEVLAAMEPPQGLDVRGAAASLGRTMPARDHDHEHVRRALVRDGWTITHDPLRLRWGGRDMYVDLGAERVLGAQKGEHKIAVEIKAFAGPSLIDDLEKAVGQYALYHDVLSRTEADRELFIAVRQTIYVDFFDEPIGRLMIDNHRLKLVVYDPTTEIIQTWTPALKTA
jgi:hypothetical protein